MSAEEYVRSFNASLLFPLVPSAWQEALRNDLFPWETRKAYIEQQLLPVLTSSGLYDPSPYASAYSGPYVSGDPRPFSARLPFVPPQPFSGPFVPRQPYVPQPYAPRQPFAPSGVSHGEAISVAPRPLVLPSRVATSDVIERQLVGAIDLTPMCPNGSCSDTSNEHLDALRHPCKFGRDCRWLARGDRRHIRRYTHVHVAMPEHSPLATRTPLARRGLEMKPLYSRADRAPVCPNMEDGGPGCPNTSREHCLRFSHPGRLSDGAPPPRPCGRPPPSQP